MLEDTFSLESLIISGLKFCFFFLHICPQSSLSLEGRSLIQTSHLCLGTPKSVISAHCSVVGLCVDCHLQQEDISLMSLSGILICGYSNMPLKVSLLLCSFCRIIKVYFPLGPMTYTVSGSWLVWQCLIWVLSHGLGLNPIKSLLIILITFVPQVHQYILKAGLCCRFQASWLCDSDDYFLNWQHTFQNHGCEFVGVEFLVGHQLDFSMLNDINKLCFLQVCLTIRL